MKCTRPLALLLALTCITGCSGMDSFLGGETKEEADAIRFPIGDFVTESRQHGAAPTIHYIHACTEPHVKALKKSGKSTSPTLTRITRDGAVARLREPTTHARHDACMQRIPARYQIK